MKYIINPAKKYEFGYCYSCDCNSNCTCNSGSTYGINVGCACFGNYGPAHC